MNLQKKPHGLGISFGYQILDKEGKVLKSSNVSKGSLDGYISVEDMKKRTKITLPMRSFVNNFINSLHGILTGDSGADTKKSHVSAGASLTASTVEKVGIQVGQGGTYVNLGDINLDNQIAEDANFVYKGTTFVPPYVMSTGKLGFSIKRLFTNTNSIGYVIEEIGIKSHRVASAGATIASNVGRLLARDLGSVTVTAESNALFSYDFFIDQAAAGNGGPVLNLMRLVYNLLFAGNQNNSTSRLISRTNNSLSTIAYASGAVASATSPFIIDGTAGEQYIGVVVGKWGGIVPGIDPDSPVYSPGGSENPDISGDETTFSITHTDLTVSANTVSAITNPYTGVSEFSVTRDFTLAGDADTKNYTRVGLLTKGTADGSTLGTDQVFLCINRPDQNIVLQPGLTLRIVYKFQIKV